MHIPIPRGSVYSTYAHSHTKRICILYICTFPYQEDLYTLHMHIPIPRGSVVKEELPWLLKLFTAMYSTDQLHVVQQGTVTAVLVVSGE